MIICMSHQKVKLPIKIQTCMWTEIFGVLATDISDGIHISLMDITVNLYFIKLNLIH